MRWVSFPPFVLCLFSLIWGLKYSDGTLVSAIGYQLVIETWCVGVLSFVCGILTILSTKGVKELTAVTLLLSMSVMHETSYEKAAEAASILRANTDGRSYSETVRTSNYDYLYFQENVYSNYHDIVLFCCVVWAILLIKRTV